MSLNKKLFPSGAAEGGPAFNILTWTGTGSATRSITGLGFQPDWVVIRSRNQSSSFEGDTFHYNSTNGAALRYRMSSTYTPNDEPTDYLKTFDSNGITVYAVHNSSSQNYVAWCWGFNSGTTASNSSCTNSSTTQVNPDFNMSIVQSDVSGDGLFGHGMSATPKLSIYKRIDNSATTFLYTTLFDNSHDGAIFGFNSKFDTSLSAPSSTCLDGVSGQDITAITFADSDICKLGNYTGTGNSGLSITTGFQVNFVMIKGISGTGIVVIDSVRGGTKRVYWGATNSESDSSSAWEISFGSTGFTINGTNSQINANNTKYIYMAFSINV